MATPYIPRADVALNSWALNFSQHIAAAPGAYGLSPAEAADITTVVERFDAALKVASEPVTRTMPAVADKNQRRAEMLWTLRYYAQGIKHRVDLSDAVKVNLGLHLNGGSMRQIPALETAPMLSVANTGPLRQELQFCDSSSTSRRAKPYGATGLMVFVAVVGGGGGGGGAGGGVGPGPEAAKFYGIATKQGFAVSFSAADAGKRAYYYGRWVNARGQMGPWSFAVSLGVAA